MSAEARLRNEICAVGASLHNQGCTTATAGNISNLLQDGMRIPPTDACPGRLRPREIAKVHMHGNWISGAQPSRTVVLHSGVYRANSRIRGIVPTHCAQLVALAPAGVWRPRDVQPPITPYHVIERLGPMIGERSVAHAAYELKKLEDTVRPWPICQPPSKLLSVAQIQSLHLCARPSACAGSCFNPEAFRLP